MVTSVYFKIKYSYCSTHTDEATFGVRASKGWLRIYTRLKIGNIRAPCELRRLTSRERRLWLW